MIGKPVTAGQVVDVAVGLPVPQTYHYLMPARLHGLARVGVRVQVPFGKRKVVTGFVVGLPELSERTDLREIDDIPDPEAVFNERQLEFYRFIAHYYFAPLGEVIRTALPAGLFKSTRPVIALTEAGRKALAGPLLDTSDRALLDHLVAGEELTLKALETRLGRDPKSDVQRLLRWNFVTQRYRLSPLTAKRKLERCWRLRPGLSLEEAVGMLGRSTPKRLAVLQALASTAGWISMAQLAEKVADPRATVNLLVAAGLVEETDREVYRDIACEVGCFAASEVVLHPEQRHAVEVVERCLTGRHYRAFCLHGVTGSGKTEVYLRLVERCLKMGRSAVVLVPEISLTPQFLGRFVSRLGSVIAPYHSQLSDGERYDQWRKMQRGEARVVVGARSALFAPFENIGLIVVDEEHEPSFKQEDGVTYHARDMALKLGTLHQCPVVLGSATPSLETYAAAKAGRFHLLELTERPTGAPMPKVEMIDMREVMAHRPRRKGKTLPEPSPRKETTVRRVLSERLLTALRETHAAGEQAILFLNRRGYSTYAVCLECGTPLRCPLCDIALTYHEKAHRLHCHYCDYQAPPPATCAKCAGVHLFFGGMGTERLEKEVAEALPGARLLRMDRDTIRKRGDLYDVLGAFARREADILVGTQMVAKGHDFPAVTLVGVIDADAALLFPDFRAAERAFQLVSQVAGRAGRADLPGRVLLQSFQPEHYALVAASRHDYPAFFAEESRRRAELHYPPAGRLAVLKITSPNAKAGLEACRIAARAGTWATSLGDIASAATLGPAASLMHRLQGKHHWNLLIKAEKPSDLMRLCKRLLSRLGDAPPVVTFKLDVDPVTLA